MGTGYLTVQVRTGDDALPVRDAYIVLSDAGGVPRYGTYTDGSGNTAPLSLPAPDKQYTLDPNYEGAAYSTWDVSVIKAGFADYHVHGVEVEDEQTSILPVNMVPLTEGGGSQGSVDIDIPPVGLLLPDGEQPGSVQMPRVLSEVVIPDYITVHLGAPSNASARNIRVRFTDYIKNVASSEIYATWPHNALVANVHVIVTFALNRVYTEWYRSRGYAFDITNNTGYDQYYREGAQVFQNIANIVDDVFNVYARRIGFRNPFFTSFCNGTTATCSGLSQWGTVDLANRGYTPLQILRHYYPSDLELVSTDNIAGIPESYPGTPLRVGSRGEAVMRMQNYLNRIRVNYPLIPTIANPNGTFGSDTEAAVKAFQKIFSLAQDGVVGRGTWNKISSIYVGIIRLAELDSEGERVTIGQNPPGVVLSQGSRGANVLELQFILNAIAPFYNSVPTVIQDGVFGAGVKSAVAEFQKTFGLTADGVVGPATWNKLYSVYRSVHENVTVPPVTPPAGGSVPYPGTLLRVGSSGADVRLMQTYLNTIRIVYPGIPAIAADGQFGSETRRAVTAFQNTFLLSPDGIIGPTTWNAIVEQYRLVTGSTALAPPYPGIPLRTGSTGGSVRLMQGFLADLRTRYPALPAVAADGIFGTRTGAAVTAFQRMFGLSADGIIGPATWNAIVRERNQIL